MSAPPTQPAKVIRIRSRAAAPSLAPSLTDESLAIDVWFGRRLDPSDRVAPPHARPPRAAPGCAKPKPRLHALTGYYISRDTIYGPERSGEFYVHGERIYLSRRALGTRADIPGAAARELGRVLGDLAGMPRSFGTVANRVPGRDIPPIPTGYFTINGRIYGGLGRATDPIAGIQRAGDATATSDQRRTVAAQLAKGEFRISSGLIYGPAGRRVPWLTALAPAKHAATPVNARRSGVPPRPAGESTKSRPGHPSPRTTKKRRRKTARRPRAQAA